MNVEEMVKEYLVKHKFDGLCSEEEDCGCLVSDLAPCGEMRQYCIAAYNHGGKRKFSMMREPKKGK